MAKLTHARLRAVITLGKGELILTANLLEYVGICTVSPTCPALSYATVLVGVPAAVCALMNGGWPTILCASPHSRPMGGGGARKPFETTHTPIGGYGPVPPPGNRAAASRLLIYLFVCRARLDTCPTP